MEKDSEMEKTVKKTKKPKRQKETKKGVVYLSIIPTAMTVKKIREEFSKYGEVGNIFLQPDDKAPPHLQKYSEGWVEFFDKRVAKAVATTLNNNQVGGRKKHPWYADIWNIKYLPKFQWAHLNERLAYERAIHEQRLRVEISQIKKEASFHKENFRKSKIKDKEDKKKKKEGEATGEESPTFTFKQRDLEDEILAKKRKAADDGDEREGEGGKKKKPRRRERTKQSNFRPDADHSFGALSLAANKTLMKSLFGGGGS